MDLRRNHRAFAFVFVGYVEIAIFAANGYSTMLSIDQQIGERVRWHREAALVSVEVAAAHISISVDEYEAKEAGERRFWAHELLDITRRLGIKLSDLFADLQSSI